MVIQLSLELEQQWRRWGVGAHPGRQGAASIPVSIIKRSARLEPVLIKCLH